jgi:hypothetical protein
VQEMAEAVDAAADLSPEACREAGRRHFSATAMVERYLALYQALAEGTPGGGAFDRQSPGRSCNY